MTSRGLRSKNVFSTVWVIMLWGLAATFMLSATEWRLTHNEPESNFTNTLNTLVAVGFRPICLDGNGVGQQTRFSAIWVKDGFTIGWLSTI